MEITKALGSLYAILSKEGRAAYEVAYKKFEDEERVRTKAEVLKLLDGKSTVKEASYAFRCHLLRREDLGLYDEALACFYEALAPRYPQYKDQLLRLCKLGTLKSPDYAQRTPRYMNDVFLAYEEVIEPLVISVPEGKEMIRHLLLTTVPGGQLPSVPRAQNGPVATSSISAFEYDLHLGRADRPHP